MGVHVYGLGLSPYSRTPKILRIFEEPRGAVDRSNAMLALGGVVQILR